MVRPLVFVCLQVNVYLSSPRPRLDALRALVEEMNFRTSKLEDSRSPGWSCLQSCLVGIFMQLLIPTQCLSKHEKS